MPVVFPPGYAQNLLKQRYLDAAQACDDLARKLGDQQRNFGTLAGQVSTAWQGAAATSLEQAVSDGGRALNSAISDVQSAAQAFRAAASKINVPTHY